MVHDAEEAAREGRAHAGRMGAVYSVGPMAATVQAGGVSGLMNLGWADDPTAVSSSEARQAALIDLVIECLELTGREAVVDLGCGRGGLLTALAGQNLRAFGVNIDVIQLEACPSPRRVVQADVVALPLGDSTLDRVTAVELLSHVADKDRFFTEVARTLADGGRFVAAVIVLNRALGLFNPVERTHLGRLADFFDERLEDIPTLPAVVAAIRRGGMTVTRTVDLTDGVFVPRHEDFVLMLRRLRSADPAERRAMIDVVERQWSLELDHFEGFLAANVASHACRYYEYHLVVATKPARR